MLYLKVMELLFTIILKYYKDETVMNSTPDEQCQLATFIKGCVYFSFVYK